LNIKERIMAVLHGERPDRIPWTTYSVFLPRGTMGRELRNMGLGIIEVVQVHTEETPNVQVEQKVTGDIVKTFFHTPVGTISQKERTKLPFSGVDWLGGLLRSLGHNQGVWIMEHMFEDVSDYEVLRFIVEDTVYHPRYDDYKEVERSLEDDGVIFAATGHSPLQKLLLDYIGYQTFAVELYKHPHEFEKLLDAVDRKQDELYKVMANSPAELIWCGDNINGVVTSPKLFEKYVVPFYRKQVDRLHRKDKILAVHMDGRLASLKGLIPEGKVDVVEAFTPPPMGDLPPNEARETWGDDQTIWINFPESVALQGADAVKKRTSEILKSIAPGDNFLIGVTEDIPPELLGQTLKAMGQTLLKREKYP